MPYVSFIEKDAIERGWEKGLKKGLEEGLEKGMEEGLEKGMEKGLEKGMEKGLEKGLEKGMEKGLEKGVIYASQENIITVLRTRFGRVPLTALRQIKSLKDSKQLEKLLQKAVTVQSLKDFKI